MVMAISQKSLDSSSMRKESHSSTHAARTGLRNLQNPWLLKKRRDFFAIMHIHILYLLFLQEWIVFHSATCGIAALAQ